LTNHNSSKKKKVMNGGSNNNSSSFSSKSLNSNNNINNNAPPEKPPRSNTSSRSNNSSSKVYSHRKPTHKKNALSETDFADHHTLGTAATASATISYSTDQGDDASEVGMEVIMSSASNDHHHHHTTASAATTRGGASSVQVLNSAASAAVAEVPYESHSFPAGKHTFTVDKRYAMIRTIGSGAYGVVISATDSKAPRSDNKDKRTTVAIKMVPKAFSDEIDAKRILREIKLLKHFRHENIVQLLDMMPPNVKYLEDFTDVYLVADLMETDLHRIIYSKQKLSMEHAQYFIYQVLRGLKYIHSCRVLHRDLKPSNLLVNSNCDLKICDFGLARGIHRDPDPAATGQSGSSLLLTEYVVTRWYRAPEIMLACHEYSYPIDVWSVGCIFAELILRKPYFPGDDYIAQLTIIADKLGKLSEADLDFVTSEKAKRFMKKLPNKAPVHLSLQFPGASLEALDVLRKMLEIHPSKRITVNQALEHPFFESLHNPSDEPVSSRPFDFSFENEKLHRLRLQELIWREVGSFRPEVLPVAPIRGDSGKSSGGGRSSSGSSKN
jgi:mitogen-activated protein kinase 1/3